MSSFHRDHDRYIRNSPPQYTPYGKTGPNPYLYPGEDQKIMQSENHPQLFNHCQTFHEVYL